MDNNNDMDDKIDIIIYIVAFSLSLVANFFVYCFFKKEQSLYFSLLKIISLFEITFIFSKLILITNKKDSGLINFIKENLPKIKIIKFSPFKLFENFDLEMYNKYFYDSMKRVYIILNFILCLETINLITRPFSQSKKKAKLYYLISAISIIISFILEKILDENNSKWIDRVLYIIFVVLGIISIIFVIIRFCLNKPLIQSAKNCFVMRHIIYIFVLSVIYLNELDWVGHNQFIKNLAIFGLGFIMSVIKISDEFLCIKDKTKSKSTKGVTSLITANLNVEFMCCILYGMTDIFIKHLNSKSSNNSFSKNEKKIHTIKYLKTIDSKRDDFKDIKMHVSTKESLLKSYNENDDINIENNNKMAYTYSNESLNSTSNEEDALIIEFLPEIFNDLRQNDLINDEVMIKTFSPSKNKSAIDKMSESKGKSGSFFFYSHDRKFIIKTISSDEKNTLLNILHDYYNYIKNHQSSLITKIYGIYTLVIKNASSVNIILMQNLFGCSPIHIQKMFDLKGSSVQRKTKNVQKWKRDQVLKDLDFQWLTKVERKLINFKEEDITEITNNLNNDIIFYQNLRLMDYSLLLIIIDFPNNIDPDYKQITDLLEDPKYKGHVYKSENGDYIYIIGIIDYLQKYNLKKKVEHCLKAIIYGKDKNMISAVEPTFYGIRFNEFMTKNVFITGEN